MALGGGTWTSQNKVLPGSYINVKSSGAGVVTMGDRGVVALPISLNWAPDGVFSVTAEDFQRNSMAIFGYPYTADEMQPFREVFKHAQKVLVYNINDSGGVAAEAAQGGDVIARAKFKGSRGNSLKLVVQHNVDSDDTDVVDVTVYMDNTVVHQEIGVFANGENFGENPYVEWLPVTYNTTAGITFTGGANGTSSTTSYQNALNAFEAYTFNVLACPHGAGEESLMAEYTKRMRDTNGIKFQLVCVGNTADYEGIVSIIANQSNTLYWTAGALAGCAINKSCTNMKYDGELEVTCINTQSELEDFIKTGKFAFHKVEDDVRVLMDINTLVTFTDDKGEVFSKNQTIRVVDQKHNDVKRVFNTKYLGQIQNDSAGRASFWGDVVKLSETYANMRAIEPFDTKSLTVELGDTPNAVVVNDTITVIGSMEKLYMTIVCN